MTTGYGQGRLQHPIRIRLLCFLYSQAAFVQMDTPCIPQTFGLPDPQPHDSPLPIKSALGHLRFRPGPGTSGNRISKVMPHLSSHAPSKTVKNRNTHPKPLLRKANGTLRPSDQKAHCANGVYRQGNAFPLHGAPGGGRTHNLCLRRATLYPIELRVRTVRTLKNIRQARTCVETIPTSNLRKSFLRILPPEGLS